MSFTIPYNGNLAWLQDRTILYVRHGSHAYGTNVEGSDYDYKGVCVPPREYFHGCLKHFEQAESKEPDSVIYNVCKFVKLAADCNPSIIEVLWVDESDVLIGGSQHFDGLNRKLGHYLRDHRSTFISKKCRFTFSGYAIAQLKRIKLHRQYLLSPPHGTPTRAEFGLPERTIIPADQLAAANSAIRKKLEEWQFAAMDDFDEAQKIALRHKMEAILSEVASSSTDLHNEAARSIGCDDNFIRLLDLERRYESKKREWQKYVEWKTNRNESRAELEAKWGYDCYLDDTEFLTEFGWRRYGEISVGDKLGTLNQKTGGLEFQHFSERVEKAYDGPILFIETKDTCCAVTPNHRMWLSPIHRNQKNNFSSKYEPSDTSWQILSADEMMSHHRSHWFARTSTTGAHLPVDRTDEYLALIGAYVSEGCVGKRLSSGAASVLRFSQKKGNRLENVMHLVGSSFNLSRYEYQRRNRNTPCVEVIWTLADRTVASQVVSECGELSHNKRLPSWIGELSRDKARFLLHCLVAGDGTVKKHTARVYYTISKQLADDMQRLCLVAGYSSRLWGPYSYDERPDVAPMYQVYIGTKDTTNIVSRGHSVNVQNIIGRIVCFTVPNEILVTRRLGKIAIQGNTKHAMHLVRLMRMCREILEIGTVTVRRPDADELKSIRAGAWSYDKLIDWAESSDKALEQVYQDSNLPHSPDRNAIDKLCIGIVESML